MLLLVGGRRSEPGEVRITGRHACDRDGVLGGPARSLGIERVSGGHADPVAVHDRRDTKLDVLSPRVLVDAR
jgi:hypothetical protein